MLFQTTSAHEELRAKIRSFAEEEIKPLAFLMDQNNEFPDEAVKKLGKLGWMGIPYPKEYGGAGLDALSYAIAVEELARVDGGAGVILSAHVSLGSWPIFAYGTEEQKKKYLVPLAKGEKIGAFGLTEPNAGSDAGGTETTALDKGDYYLLNGGKIFSPFSLLVTDFSRTLIPRLSYRTRLSSFVSPISGMLIFTSGISASRKFRLYNILLRYSVPGVFPCALEFALPCNASKALLTGFAFSSLLPTRVKAPVTSLFF